MNRLFEIQTLSANQVPKRYNPNIHYLPHGYQMKKRKRSLADYGRLADPVTVITGILTVLPSLFPGLTGAEPLTMNQLNTLFPGNGHYTTQYKNWLLQRVKYTKDLERDLHMYTGKFIENNLGVFCPNWSPGQPGQQCWQGFYKVLQQESITGGQSPVGNIYGAGFDFQTLALVGGGVLLLALLMKKKTRKK